MDILTSNKTIYESKNSVKKYSCLTELTPPEALILRNYEKLLRDASMLDLGVGAGRTTRHFAPIVKKYVGIDFSKPMIAACQKYLAPQYSHADFQWGDARDLSRFPNDQFEFILFSYNGIDCVDEKDRKTILTEIFRICKPGGAFCFSSHNLSGLRSLYQKGVPFSKWISNFLYRKLLETLNPNFRKKLQQEITIIHDRGSRLKLRVCYVTIPFQISQLKALGFENIKIADSNSEKEVDLDNLFLDNNTYWTYYTCVKPSNTR